MDRWPTSPWFLNGPRRLGDHHVCAVPQSGSGWISLLWSFGRFKVFKHLLDWFEEFRLYHRKDGKVKEGDDLLAATRYGIMMLRYARTESEWRNFHRTIDHTNMPRLAIA